MRLPREPPDTHSDTTMRKLLAILILIGVAQLPLDAQERRYEVVGYYPSWKYRTDTHLLTPAKIPFGMLTVINYAFFYPLPDGTITGRDPAGDATILNVQGADPGKDAAASLTALAHARGVRVLLSIGGWEDSGNFPSVAADAASRGRFARSCAAAISAFGFDGIDIDWEFPGFAEHNGTPADGMNYIRLLRVLRDTLDSAGLQAAGTSC